MKSLQEIYNKLDLKRENGLYFTSENVWKSSLKLSKRIEKLIEDTICPDSFFCIDNKPIILFFYKPENKERLHKQIWNFNESAIVVIVEDSMVNVYNGFKYEVNLKSLAQFNVNILDDLNYFKIVTGKTWTKYSSDIVYKNRVDYWLLNNIKEAQKQLVSDCSLQPKIANALVGKCIFVRYLIDRKVNLNTQQFGIEWTKNGFNELLKDKNLTINFFKYLAGKFNGDDIFSLSDIEYNSIPDNALNVLIGLLRGDELKSGQPSLFDLYDFSVIPTEFISNIYESFIGTENQADSGAYYTPLFLVDYILNETIEKHFESNDSIVDCKILDPACGSGVFLVESLRKLIERYMFLNPKSKLSPNEFKEVIKEITKRNIWGIDKDEKAVQVAVFSIYLTLLDYQLPADIETFTFPKLIGTNFFTADFFDTEASYNEIIKKEKLDFIVGNPPWKGDKVNEVKGYIGARCKQEKKQNKNYKAHVNNGEIAEAFLIRTSDFCSENTKCSLIVRSSILYNIGYSDHSQFRQYFCEEFCIDNVFELAPVRHELFDKSNGDAIAPAAIISFRYANGNITDDNIVTHITLKPSKFFSIFKILTIYHSDFKRVKQSLLKENDWLWKTLVYGSYLDFNFIRKIKHKYEPIASLFLNNDRFAKGTGLEDIPKKSNSKPKSLYDASHLKGRDFIDSRGVSSFFINEDKITPFNKEKVHRLRTSKIFTAPILLTLTGADMKTLMIKSALSKKDLLYKKAITGIKGDITSLRSIQGIFNSLITPYFTINTLASVGIEREQIRSKERFSLPFVDINIANICEKIESLNIEIYNLKKNVSDNFIYDNIAIEEKELEVSKLLENINSIVLAEICDNETDKILIDYANNVIRPFILPNCEIERQILLSNLQLDSQELNDYAQLYINQFRNGMKVIGRTFIVRIKHSTSFVLMQFEMIPTKEYSSDIIWEKLEDSNIIKFLMNIGCETLTDRIVIQKDIRGFEKEFFYIAKPNERRLWHRAIGLQDVQEFVDAIMISGRREVYE